MLEIRTDEATGAAPRTGAAHGAPGDGAGVVLALNAMSDGQRSGIADVLSRFADQVERDHNPFVEDLDDQGDATPAVERLVSVQLPRLTAAAALSTGRWASSDGRMTVRATTACAPDARCIPLSPDASQPEEDRVSRRARFLAWPVADSVGVRIPVAIATAVVDALRAPAEGSRIALVVREDDLRGLRPSAALGSLAQSASRLDQLLPDDAPLRELFRQISASGERHDDLSWLELPQGAILIVPRLGALATLGAFVDEVRTRVATAAGPAQVQWLWQPPLTGTR
jgi:hypothetical protein